MSTFEKHDLLGEPTAPPEREPGRRFESPVCPECADEHQYGVCARCGTKGIVWRVGDEWVCWRNQCNR